MSVTVTTSTHQYPAEQFMLANGQTQLSYRVPVHVLHINIRKMYFSRLTEFMKACREQIGAWKPEELVVNPKTMAKINGWYMNWAERHTYGIFKSTGVLAFTDDLQAMRALPFTEGPVRDDEIHVLMRAVPAQPHQHGTITATGTSTNMPVDTEKMQRDYIVKVVKAYLSEKIDSTNFPPLKRMLTAMYDRAEQDVDAALEEAQRQEAEKKAKAMFKMNEYAILAEERLLLKINPPEAFVTLDVTP